MGTEPRTISKADALAEAYKRGLLPPDKKAAYEEAQKRGLVGAAQPAPAEPSNGAGMGMVAMGAGMDRVPASQPQPTPRPSMTDLRNVNRAPQMQGPNYTNYGEGSAMGGADIGKGLKTLPQRAANAVIGAAEATANLPADLINSARQANANTVVDDRMAMLNANRMPQLQDRVGAPQSATPPPMLPTIDAPRVPIAPEDESITGSLIEGLGQWILGRVAIGKLAKGGGIVSGLAKDLGTTGIVFQSDTGRVADMIELDAIPEGPLRDFAAMVRTQPEDSPIVGRLKNVLEDALMTGPALVPQTAIRGGQAVVKGIGEALNPAAVPTNAGAANPGPINAAAAMQPPAAQAAPQPSVAPIPQPTVSNAPRRGAQAGATGAGQGGGPPTLQATQVPANPAVAKDTQDILRKLLIDSNVPRNDVDRLLVELTNDFQVFKGSGSPVAARVGLGEFVDSNVRQTANRIGVSMTPDVERQIQNALRGRGRAAHGSEGGSKQDRQPSVMSQYIEDLRTTQKDWAREQIEAPNAFNKADISVQKQAMEATADDIGQQVYGEGLKLAKDVWSKAAPAAPGEIEALTKLQTYLNRKPYLDNIPASMKLRLAIDDIPLETRIANDPAGTAHWIQSKLGKAASEAADPDMRSALGEARERLLRELEAAVPAYKQARADFGDEYATMRAFDFGRPFFAETRRPLDVSEMKADYGKMTTRQKTAARMAVRDEIFGVFGMNAEDAAVRLEVLTRENTLNALEEVFGAPGKRVADTLRRLRQESNWMAGDKSRGLPGVDIYSGSNTVANAQILNRDAASVRNGFQRAIAKAGDVSKFMFAVPADLALMVGSGGAYHLPMLSLGAAGGKITKGLANANPRKLSNATEGLFSLPQQAPTGAPTRAPGRVRGPASPQAPLPTDRRALLEAYAAAPSKRERERIRRALEAMGENTPAVVPPGRPPSDAGFAGVTPLAMLAGGAGGALADKENPGRGAVLGALGGTAVGYGAGRALTRSRPAGNALKSGAPKAPPRAPVGNVTQLPKSGKPNSSDLQKSLTDYANRPRTKWDDAFEKGKINHAEYDWYSSGGTADELQATKANMLETLKTAEDYPAEQVWEVYSKDPNARAALELLAADGNKRAQAIRYADERATRLPQQVKRMWRVMSEADPTSGIARLDDLSMSIGDDLAVETAKSFARMSEQPFLIARAKNITTADEAYQFLRDTHKLINGKDGRPAWATKIIRSALDNHGTFSPPKAKPTPKADVVQFGGSPKAPPASPSTVKPTVAANDTLPKGQTTPREDLARARAFSPQSITPEDAQDWLVVLRDETDLRKVISILDIDLNPSALNVPRVRAMVERTREAVLSAALKKSLQGASKAISDKSARIAAQPNNVVAFGAPKPPNGFGGSKLRMAEGGSSLIDADAIGRIASGKTVPTSAELDDALNGLRDAEFADLVRQFGGDRQKAEKFRSLWRQAENAPTRQEADMLDAQRQKLIEGMPDIAPQEFVDEYALRQLRDAFREIENGNAVGALTDSMTDLPTLREVQDGKLSSRSQAALAILRKATQEARLQGADPKQMLDAALENYGRRFSDPADAEFMVGEVKKLVAAFNAPPSSTVKPPGAPRKPPKGEGPGVASRMITGGVIGGIVGSAGSADPQTPETMALLQQTQQERSGILQEIASLENALKVFSNGSPTDIQAQLDREGFDLGPTGIDGDLGERTKAAIRGRKKEINESLTAARERLTGADGRITELERRAAFEEAQPPGWKQGAREVAPWIGSVLGATLGYRGRSGAVKKAGPKAAATIAKADALLTPGPVRKGKSAADRAAFKEQFANINEFWQMGGAGDKVPFEVTAKGDFKGRPKASIMPPTKLYPDKRFRAADYANIGVGVGEAGAAQIFVVNAEAKVAEAERAVKDNATAANIKALEAAKDELAIAQAARSAGLLYAGSRLAGSFKNPYPSSRPNVRAADAERAKLLEAMKK